MPPKKSYLFSSESVSEGHSDKVADQISDAVLDAALDQDLNARVACETLITRGLVVVAGEITTEARLESAVREIFPLTPKGIIEALDLRRPIYKKTAAYGHFGRELPEFTWERRDRTDALKAYFGIL